jgi:hypothetical protein
VNKQPGVPLDVVVQTHVPMSTAVERLARSLAERPLIEPATSLPSDRHLIGNVDGADVHLSVWDANRWSRRKSWNVEFDGAFETGESGAVLRGAIDVPDRTQLRAMMWMFRIATALAALFAIGLAVRGASAGEPLVSWPTIAAIVVVPVVIVVTSRLEADGERRAAEDAMLMTAALNNLVVG